DRCWWRRFILAQQKLKDANGEPPRAATSQTPIMKNLVRLIRWVGELLVLLATIIAIAWAFGAVWFDAPFGNANKVVAGLVAVASAIALVFVRPFSRKIGAVALLFAAALLLHRDAQEAWPNLLDYRRALPAVRTHLHRGRRARRDSPAHKLPQGGYLSLPHDDFASARARTFP